MSMKKFTLVCLALLLAATAFAQPSAANRTPSATTVTTSTTAGTGTLTTNGTTAIVGSGTSFRTALRVGRWLTIAGESARFRVTAIADDTHLTIGAAASTSASGLAWSWSECISGPSLGLWTNVVQRFYVCTDGLYALPAGGGSGTVTSVGATVPSFMTLSGSPVTTSGVLAFDFAAQSGRKFLASPSDGTSGALLMRAIIAADIPTLNQDTSGNAATSGDGVSSANGTAPLTLSLSSKALTGSIAVTPTNNGGAVALQATTPGTQQTGHVNVSGTVIAGGFSGPLTGNVTGNVSGSAGSATGNAGTATALQTARAINGVNFDGTAPITVTAAAGTLSGSTLASGVTGSSLTSLGVQAATLDLGSNALAIEIANATSTGTTTNKLVKLTGAPSTGVIAGTSDTTGILGICLSGCGTTGNAVVARAGAASCVFDGATTAGDYVQISSSVAGDCHDTGLATWPTSGGQVLGRVLSTNASGGTYLMTLHIGTQAVPAASASCSTCTSNVLQKGNGANTLQDSGITEASAGSLTTGAGVAFSAAATAPTAAASSTAGAAASLTASNATAGTTNAGAAAGGSVTFTAGNAARFTSGNANGGNIILATGSAIGTGTHGQVQLSDTGTIASPALTMSGSTGSNQATGFCSTGANSISFVASGINKVQFDSSVRIGSGGEFSFSSTSDASAADTRISRCNAACWQWGAAGNAASPIAQTVGAQNGTGTNISGGNVIYRSGSGTGTGLPGVFSIQTSFPVASGTTAQTFADRYVLFGPKTLTESSATGVADVAVASGTVTGGTIYYTIEADDVTGDLQSIRGVVQFVAVNKGGTISTQDNTSAGVPPNASPCACSAGTLTATFTLTTGTNKITLNLNAVSSLTQTVLRATGRLVLDGGTGAVSPL